MAYVMTAMDGAFLSIQSTRPQGYLFHSHLLSTVAVGAPGDPYGVRDVSADPENGSA